MRRKICFVLFNLALGCFIGTAGDGTAFNVSASGKSPAELTAFEAAAQSKAAVLRTAKSDKYGQYIVDAEGRALYMFTADTGGQSNCYDACAGAWPPLITQGEPKAGEETVQQAMIGTTKRKDGATQVTYNGFPLYYYVKDKGAGQVTGQDIKSFGGEWYLIGPDGKKIEKHAGDGHS